MKKIRNIIKNRSVPDKKATEFLLFLETKALEILINTNDISLKSVEHIISAILLRFDAKQKECKLELINLINTLSQKYLIPAKFRSIISRILTKKLKQANSKVKSKITETIALLEEPQVKISRKMYQIIFLIYKAKNSVNEEKFEDKIDGPATITPNLSNSDLFPSSIINDQDGNKNNTDLSSLSSIFGGYEQQHLKLVYKRF